MSLERRGWPVRGETMNSPETVKKDSVAASSIVSHPSKGATDGAAYLVVAHG
jgi:hypothetical protein